MPYVQVNWSQYVEAMTPNCDFGWDTHIYNFELLADRHGPILDRVFSALLDDMRQRGLLEHTLVIAHGRVRPDTEDQRPGVARSLAELLLLDLGRRRHSARPGHRRERQAGQDPITEPITPAMVGTTILELAGVEFAGPGRAARPAGRASRSMSLI